ncbi:MAG: hypothetical protein WBN40_12110, partial [Pseudomonadales bacterium]
MKKLLNSPLTRISIGLTMLTISILLIADLLGLVPNQNSAELQSRKAISESLAVQVSHNISKGQLDIAETLVRSLVERNPTILSAAVRKGLAEGLISYGDHAQHWSLKPLEESNAEQVRVPIFKDRQRWGSVEIAFERLGKDNGLLGNGIAMVILYMIPAGFLAYLLFLKRALQELNPDAVIPERVSAALD